MLFHLRQVSVIVSDIRYVGGSENNSLELGWS